MTSSIWLHCKSPIVAQAIKDYLEPSFLITPHPDHPDLGAGIFDTFDPKTIKDFHENHPHAMIYVMISRDVQTQALPFAIRILEKPFRLKSLKQQLSEPMGQSILPLNEFKLYLTSRLLVHLHRQKEIPLTEKETEILTYLYKHHPHFISKDVLLRDVWQYMSGVTTHTVETHIYKLKQKVMLSSGTSLIKTSDQGYALDL
ncbi:MAG: winged helix-turn-helix domain-containing protein [Alphaproteobacteria bacterium]